MNEKSSYAIIPSYIMDDEKIHDGAKMLYARISMYSKEGRCWASNKHLSEKHGVDVRTIQRWLKELSDQGYIDVEIETGGFQTKRNIWITNDFKKIYTKRQSCHPPASNMSPTPDTDVIHINTSNTNIKNNNVVVAREDARCSISKENTPKDSDFTKDDLYAMAIRTKRDWTSEEIEEAWIAFKKCKIPITSSFDYIEGIIKKQRVIKKNKETICKTKISQENKKKDSKKVLEKEKSQFLAKDIPKLTLAEYALKKGFKTKF